MAHSPTAVEIAEAVRGGHRTARQVVGEALERIHRTAAATGAWQVIRDDAALAEADAVDTRPERFSLPLAGVPIAIKDCVPVAGEPMRTGSLGSADEPQPRSHEVVRRLRAAGAVVVGLTRVPELCLWAATDSRFGVTRNPWDPGRTPGGSSGGAAAAVASGTVPVAHGTDGLGSIRIPAACCGLVGIKPGNGVVPSGLGANSWHAMADNGPLATTVADLALTLSVMAADPSYATAAEPGRLRIALSTGAPAPGTPVTAQWRGAAVATAQVLGGLGHEVVERELAYPTTLIPRIVALWTTAADDDLALLPHPERVDRRTARHAALGRALARHGHPKEPPREAWRARARRYFEDTGADVLLTPALARTPLPAATWHRRGHLSNLVANALYAPFAAPWNAAGWPAMAVPAGLDEHGRPLSVQLVARPGGEALLLGVAAQLEQARPWARVAPGYA